jgi:hypothetical protein
MRLARAATSRDDPTIVAPNGCFSFVLFSCNVGIFLVVGMKEIAGWGRHGSPD